jgi:hypothetical protein
MGSWRRRGRGGLIGSPAPGGSRRSPAQLGERSLHSPPCPSPPASPGRECLVPAAPSPGPEGRAGRAASYPFLPTSSPPRCEPGAAATAAAPDSRRPRAGGRWVWDRVRGWGNLAGSGRAGAIWWPCPARASASGGRLERAGFTHPNHPGR